MLARCTVIVLVVAVSGLAAAQQPTSDVFSSSGEYDRFAVGGARRWYDNHTDEARKKSSGCLSLLDEAKVYQDRALALYEQARRPGNSRNQSALVKQANDQITLRSGKLKAFTDCVNKAIRTDQFASNGSKGLKRTRPPASTRTPPSPPPTYGPVPSGPTTMDQAIDDCLKWKFADYRSPDWELWGVKGAAVKPGGEYEQAFALATLASEQALSIDEAAHGRWQDRRLMQDYLIGWVTHCLASRGVLPDAEPRLPYRASMANSPRPDSAGRRTQREDQYFFGYSNYPLPPFWDHR